MTYHHSKHETCIVMDGTCMYNCPTFFLFWKCLDDMSYWANLYRTVADNELHFFTISNLNYTVFVSLAQYSVPFQCNRSVARVCQACFGTSCGISVSFVLATLCAWHDASAALAYMAEVAYAAGPALQGPRALGQNKKMVLPNCVIESWIVFTTAI